MRERTRHCAVTLGSIALTTVLWGANPAAAGLTGVSGEVHTLNEAPADVSPEALTSDDRAFVFTEKQCEALGANLSVDVLNPSGTYRESSTQPGAIPAGTDVDSIYVHFDKVGTQGVASATGTLTFDQPVLGIIFLTATLDATDATLGAPATTYPAAPDTALRGYEDATGDTVHVSADGFTVTFSATTTTAQDELRIVTRGTCIPDAGCGAGFSLVFSRAYEAIVADVQEGNVNGDGYVCVNSTPAAKGDRGFVIVVDNRASANPAPPEQA